MRRPQPLKIGVAADLIAETGLPKDRVGKALGIHVKATSYLRATIEGAPRLDLTGKPVGTVTVEQADYARAMLKAREKRKAQA